ncbi:cell division protein ZapA [Anaerosalibacter sp. Marseille-P3206]|uniref:cell division protein ZapA n=1 Tax=Anaerosalibacter sp. Marseille-P3206 TaxID=1871005 RepID=UPI0009871E2E|nr:cell division protein ZapA [Anaerosalibacter sp. Marseille-P3206]
MTEKNKVDVYIGGRNFTVVGNETEEYVKSIAAYVNSKIREAQKKNDRLNDSMAQILVAFNIADEYHRVYKELNELKKEIVEPMQKYEEMLETLKNANKRIEELENQCNLYKDELLETKLDSENKDRMLKKYKQASELKEEELKENQKIIKNLQDKLFDSQIELVEIKKELDETLKHFNENS